MPIMAICSPGRKEACPAALPARPSLFRRLHLLTKLLKLRPQLRELENPSAQNSRTVKDLAAATHWPTPEHDGEEKRSPRSPASGWPKSCNGRPRKDSGKLFFLERCCLIATL